MVARVDSLPLPGETVLGDNFRTVAGGKGANQAVAASRLGADVAFVGRVGVDSFGALAAAGLAAEGIDVAHVVRDPQAPTGVVLIGVASTGENSIIVAPGANARLTVADVDAAADVIRSADVVVCQLEIPLDCVQRAFEIARASGATTILNPAPARPLPPEVYRLTTVLIPNETEAALLCGSETADPLRAAEILRGNGVEVVIVTLGAAGALVLSAEISDIIPAGHVDSVIDTTAAGDCFTGALAVAIGEGTRLVDAVKFANSSAALSVGKAGAQPSMPTLSYIKD